MVRVLRLAQQLKLAFSALVLCLFSDAALTLTCTDLNGAYVVAYDNTYLGFFGSQFASESINNNFGTYGSQFATRGVRNQFSSYGSQFGIYSANNPYAINPPGIYKYGVRIAYLTTNEFKSGGVSLAVIDASCTFFASSPQTTQISSPGTGLPSALSGLSASNGTYNDKVALTWAYSSGATGYEVHYSLSLDGARTLYASTTSPGATVTGLTPGQPYYFFVYPKNSAGSGTGQWALGWSNTDPSPALPRNTHLVASIASNGGSSQAGMFITASKDGGANYSKYFNVADEVGIAGVIAPQTADIGAAGGIYIVIRTITASSAYWTYKDATGVFKPWNGMIASLTPAFSMNSLQEEPFIIYFGTLTKATHHVFIGYKRADSPVLHYSPSALVLTVD